MRFVSAASVGAPSLDSLHPSLAFRARLGSVSLSWGRAALLVDLGMLFLAGAATELGARAGATDSPSPVVTAAFVGLCVGLYHARGLYAARLVPDTLEDAKTAVVQTSVAAMTVLTVLLVTHLSDPSSIGAGGLIRLWGFSVVYIVAGRFALTWSQTNARRRGDAVSLTLIVGTGPVSRLVAKRLVERSDLGLLPVGFVEPGAEPATSREGDLPIPVVGSTDRLAELSRRFDVTQLVITAASGSVDEALVPMIEECEELGIAVAYVPGVYEKVGRNLRVEHVGALPLITCVAADPKGWQYTIKYALDRIVAGVLLLLVSPIFLACAAAVYLTMGRPIFFRQARVGLDGEHIGVLKFRSMRQASPQAEAFRPAAGSAPGGVEGEDRRTPVGTFLRKSSLDELPQLVNVLLGQMSLVGPRPERPEYVDQFSATVYRYGQRHRAKAGITGWAQVHGLRGQTSVADRAEWDNWYIENFSFWLDLKILLLTVAAVLRFARQGE